MVEVRSYRADALRAARGAGYVGYDGTNSGIVAATVQGALDEVKAAIPTSIDVPAATETTAGVVEHATKAEVEAGTAGNRVATAARLKAELDRRQTSEAWISPVLINGWVNYGVPHATAAYMKDPLGFVVVKGLIKSGTVGAAAFTLPVGYRPAESHIFGGAADTGTYTALSIGSGGSVTIVAGSTSWTSLAGIRFKAEA